MGLYKNMQSEVQTCIVKCAKHVTIGTEFWRIVIHSLSQNFVLQHSNNSLQSKFRVNYHGTKGDVYACRCTAVWRQRLSSDIIDCTTRTLHQPGEGKCNKSPRMMPTPSSLHRLLRRPSHA